MNTFYATVTFVTFMLANSLLAQVKETVDGATKITEQASKYGPEVWLATLIILAVFAALAIQFFFITVPGKKADLENKKADAESRKNLAEAFRELATVSGESHASSKAAATHGAVLREVAEHQASALEKINETMGEIDLGEEIGGIKQALKKKA